MSVGNLRVGGTGKTPTVAHLARLLLEMGERPAILSRGYARRVVRDGVVVVSDGHRLCADLDQSGDEPMLLARAVEGAAVLVAADRHLAGRLAETHLGATVHLLDDGFQHLPLWRGTDLLIVTPEDIDHPRTLPMGRLREPLSAGAAADAILAADATDDEASAINAALAVPHLFRLTRQPGAAQQMGPFGPRTMAPTSAPGVRDGGNRRTCPVLRRAAGIRLDRRRNCRLRGSPPLQRPRPRSGCPRRAATRARRPS